MNTIFSVVIALLTFVSTLSALPREVLIISYAEPTSSYGLTTIGYERADLLANYFENTLLDDGYSRAEVILSAQPSVAVPGSAAILTITPTSRTLIEPIHTQMPTLLAATVNFVLTSDLCSGKSVLIVWDFEDIPALIDALGYDAPPLPSPACYARTYVLPTFPPTDGEEPSVLNQNLITGDTRCGGHAPPPPPPPPPPPGPPTPASVSGYIPFVIYNGSQTIDDDEVFFVIVSDGFTKAVQFTLTSGHYRGAPVSPVPSSSDQSTYFLTYYSKKLTEIESLGGGYYVFYLPNNVAMLGARMYFSVNGPLPWWITSGGQIQQLDDVYELNNPNYYTLFDKVELTIANIISGWQLVMNSTLVDFYSLPLSFYITALPGPTTQYTGLSPTIPREKVFNTYETNLLSIPGDGADTWANLNCSYTGPNGQTTRLRINASNAAASQTSPANLVFPTDYLQNNPWSACQWLNQVWSNALNNSYYHDDPLTVGLSLSLSSAGTATGTVNSAGDFIFTINTDSDHHPGTIKFPRPVSDKAFFTGAVADCDPQPLLSGNATDEDALILWQIFSSAFNAGFHPVIGTTTGDPLNQDYIRTLSSSYYTNSSDLCTGPWYDFYSGVMYNGLGTGNYTEYYTSPFTDVLGISGVITIDDTPSNLPKVYITLGSLSDTVLPDPFDDTHTYTVVCTGLGSGTEATFNGSPFSPSSDPVIVEGNNMSLGVTYTTGPYAAASPWEMQIAPSVPMASPVIPGGFPTMSLDTTTTPYPTLSIKLGGAPSSD